MMPAVPCAHIADYYQQRCEQHKCIGNNLLRIGYRQWSEGRVRPEDVKGWNNLYFDGE